MSRGLRGALAAGTLLLAGWGMGAAQSPSSVHRAALAADTSSVLDGVFTEGQASRGKDVFDVTCMRCHALADFTTGPHAPTKKWTSVGGLFAAVSMRMPYDDPGTLSQPEYAAVVSYLLQQNGYPAKGAELSSDLRKLLLIRIVPPVLETDGMGDSR